MPTMCGRQAATMMPTTPIARIAAQMSFETRMPLSDGVGAEKPVPWRSRTSSVSSQLLV